MPRVTNFVIPNQLDLNLYRYGGLGRLSVRKLSAEGPPTFIDVQGPLTHSRLDVNDNTEIYIGGAMQDVQVYFNSILFLYRGFYQ